MELYNRRLLLLNEEEPSSSDDISSPPRLTAAPLSSSLFVTPLKLSAPVPFNSDVAYILIIILLLIAFLVMFIRRFADHSPASEGSPPASSNYHSPSSSCGGLDQTTVQSLPVFRYNAEAKQPEDCAICLSEFEIGETVKMVPNCKHMFHRECIDTWLSSHVTCPICRGSKFFAGERQSESVKVVEPTSDNQIVRRQAVASTVENGTTLPEGRTMGTSCNQRRSRSCSNFRDTVVLRRTLSY